MSALDARNMAAVKMNGKVQVWQCGGGTQSVAIAVLICQGKLPKPDFSVIADTGYERSSTWDYMDSVLVPRLKENGVGLVRVRASEYAYQHDGLFNNKGTLLLPAFSTKSENEKGSKLSNFCTSYWKRDVTINYLRREHGVAEKECRKWIGFSIDEMRRAVRMMNSEDFKAGRIYFPLIELRKRRWESIQLVIKAGWPLPPRSNCYFCPNQTDDEWIDLKSNFPKEFQMAIEYEAEVRLRDPEAFFHESRIPLGEVVFSNSSLARSCDSGMCFL
jgi:hypothetical protein